LTNEARRGSRKRPGVTVVAPERRSRNDLQKFVASEIKKWAGPIKPRSPQRKLLRAGRANVDIARFESFRKGVSFVAS